MKKVDSKGFIAEADDKLTQLFRKQRKMLLYNRSGVVLFVDDMPEQMSFLESICEQQNLGVSFKNVQDLESATDYVTIHGADNIKVVVVDIGLGGQRKNQDGLRFIQWLRNYYPQVPFIISTGRSDCIDEIKRIVPGADIFVKGDANLVDYLDAFGISPSKITVEESPNVLPTDSRIYKAMEAQKK